MLGNMNLNQKQFLIIGSNGFIGKNLANFFLSRNIIVYGMDFNNNNPGLKNFIKASGKIDDITNKIDLSEIDYIINAAGSANVGFSMKSPSIDFNLNTYLVFSHLNLIKENNPKIKYINFSSAAVYGSPMVLPIGESMSGNPISPYGYHKYISEIICKEYYSIYGINSASLRVFSAYGPLLKKQIFGDLYNKAINAIDNKIELFGTGDETRDFIFIEDLIHALICIIENSEFNADIINIASGTAIKIKDAVSIFFEKYNKKIRYEFNKIVRAGDPKYWQADIMKLTQYGFRPQYTIDSGLTKYISWLLQTEKK
jgi:UDP-glucose 4-epimerase